MSSSVERDNPPPRRKSCDACRAAKRRCDLALPACFRCTRRNIACSYPGLPAPDQIPEMLARLNEQEGPASACAGQFDFDPAAGLDFPELERPRVQRSPLQHQPPGDPVSLVYLNDRRELMHVPSNVTVPLSTLMSSRFQYPIDTLKDTPRMMVQENQTPWSHSELYRDGMPKAMQDAYACCALYISKNAINGPMITAHIHSRHQELSLSPLPTSSPELLAYTHALLLYQIMHLFDPDLHAANTKASIDTLSMAALESAASLLFSSTHFPPSPDPDTTLSSSSISAVLPSAIEPTTHFWTLWIFEESARRTILFTFYFLQILRLFRNDRNLKCDGKLGLLHSWYFSAHLWTAPSALDFAAAWAEKEHFIVRNANFERVLREAQPGDVDTLGRMLLVTSLGVEKITEWFWSRGDIL